MKISYPFRIIITRSFIIPSTKAYFILLEKADSSRKIPIHLVEIGSIQIPKIPGDPLNSINVLLGIFGMFWTLPYGEFFLDSFLTQTFQQRLLVRHATENTKKFLEGFSERDNISSRNLHPLGEYYAVVGQRMFEQIWENDDAFQSILNDIDRIIKEHEEQESTHHAF